MLVHHLEGLVGADTVLSVTATNIARLSLWLLTRVESHCFIAA